MLDKLTFLQIKQVWCAKQCRRYFSFHKVQFSSAMNNILCLKETCFSIYSCGSINSLFQ